MEPVKLVIGEQTKWRFWQIGLELCWQDLTAEERATALQERLNRVVDALHQELLHREYLASWSESKAEREWSRQAVHRIVDAMLGPWEPVVHEPVPEPSELEKLQVENEALRAMLATYDQCLLVNLSEDGRP